MEVLQRKALMSALISLGGSLAVIAGQWLISGTLDMNVLRISLATSAGSWLISLGKSLQQSLDKKDEPTETPT